MARVVLLTGGNLGPVAENLEAVSCEIAREVGPIVERSSVRESEAWGFEAKERFLNQVLVVETELDPREVLRRCQRIEQHFGRVRHPGQGYASRTMDIDILFYDRRIIDTPDLRIPHPLIGERDFVLAPLEEIMGNFIHPVSGCTIRQMRRSLQERDARGELSPSNDRK